jgi:hypothetical protein
LRFGWVPVEIRLRPSACRRRASLGRVARRDRGAARAGHGAPLTPRPAPGLVLASAWVLVAFVAGAVFGTMLPPFPL